MSFFLNFPSPKNTVTKPKSIFFFFGLSKSNIFILLPMSLSACDINESGTLSLRQYHSLWKLFFLCLHFSHLTYLLSTFSALNTFVHLGIRYKNPSKKTACLSQFLFTNFNNSTNYSNSTTACCYTWEFTKDASHNDHCFFGCYSNSTLSYCHVMYVVL